MNFGQIDNQCRSLPMSRWAQKTLTLPLEFHFYVIYLNYISYGNLWVVVSEAAICLCLNIRPVGSTCARASSLRRARPTADRVSHERASCSAAAAAAFLFSPPARRSQGTRAEAEPTLLTVSRVGSGGGEGGRGWGGGEGAGKRANGPASRTSNEHGVVIVFSAAGGWRRRRLVSISHPRRSAFLEPGTPCES